MVKKANYDFLCHGFKHKEKLSQKQKNKEEYFIVNTNESNESKLRTGEENNGKVSRKEFINKAGKVILLGTIAHFSLIGGSYKAKGATGDKNDCGGDANDPKYAPIPCDANDNPTPCQTCISDSSCSYLAFDLPCLQLPSYYMMDH